MERDKVSRTSREERHEEDKGFIDDPVNYILDLIRSYFSRLCDAFGWKYVAIIICIYGLNQGIGEAVLFTAQRYYYLDVLNTSGRRYTQIGGFINIPWQIKAMYGMISDSTPIYGLRRTPYCVGAGLIGTISALLLWLTGAGRNMAAVFLLFANLSIASPDVMIDATTAEKAKTQPRLTADLQALCWGSLYFFGSFAQLASGYLVKPKVLGPRHLFAGIMLTSCACLIPSSLGWLGEKSQAKPYTALSSESSSEDTRSSSNPMHAHAIDTMNSIPHEEPNIMHEEPQAQKSPKDQENQRVVFFAAVTTCAASMIIGLVQMFYYGSNSTAVEGGVTVGLGGALALALYYLLRRISPELAGTAVYIFLEGAFQPLTEVISDWSHSDDDKHGNCSRHCKDRNPEVCGWARRRNYPCISPEYYGIMKAVAKGFGFVGVIIFNSFFKHWQYRRIYTLGQTVFLAVNLLDLVWVSRLNLRLGITDKLFLLGADIITPVLSTLHIMPAFILAARLCPENLEGTVFALLMSLSNFGSAVGGYNGAGLLALFGGVEKPEFRHLSSFVFVRTLIFVVPIIIIPCLIPKGSPDGDPTENDDLETTGGPYPRSTPSEIELASYSAPTFHGGDCDQPSPSYHDDDESKFSKDSSLSSTEEVSSYTKQQHDQYDEVHLVEVAADVVLL